MSTSTENAPTQSAPKDKTTEKKIAKRMSERAGVLMPVVRIERKMKADTKRVSVGAPIAAGVIMQTIASKIFTGAAEKAYEDKRSRIKPRDIKKAIENDTALSRMIDSKALIGADIKPTENKLNKQQVFKESQEKKKLHLKQTKRHERNMEKQLKDAYLLNKAKRLLAREKRNEKKQEEASSDSEPVSRKRSRKK